MKRSGFGSFFNFGSRGVLSFFLLLRKRFSPSPGLLFVGVRRGVFIFWEKANIFGFVTGGITFEAIDIVGSPVCVRDPKDFG
jgi:hypothetical protein